MDIANPILLGLGRACLLLAAWSPQVVPARVPSCWGLGVLIVTLVPPIRAIRVVC